MSLPTLMQKGLSALLNVVKVTEPSAISQAITSLSQHFTLSAYEIAGAYQKSYTSALNAIIAGLDKPSVFNSKVSKEFAKQVVPKYLQPFAVKYAILDHFALQQFCTDTITKCQTLIPFNKQVFKGEETKLTEPELAALITDTDSLSITALVLEELRPLEIPSLCDEKFVAFLRYNDLLGTAILFFLHEQLRQESRVESTLAELQRKGLWQDVYEIKDSLSQLMAHLDLSPQIKARDELTYHNNESLKRIGEATTQLKKLPRNHPQYSQLALSCGSVLSSTGALPEAEKCFLQAMENNADRALALFNLFQVKVRRNEFEPALATLQEAISIAPQQYALHDIDKYPIKRILGAGGMGCVFLCSHKLQKKPVVVKCFWENHKGSAEEVFKEAFTMSEIAGEYVPAPLDYGYVDPVKQERAFFVTEHITGAMDGETWLEQKGKLNAEVALQVGLQMAKGLKVAHAAGVLHLDLKPANILLKQIDSGIIVKIIDFGLSQVATPLQQKICNPQIKTQLSQFGQAVFGTLDYAAPEQQGFEHLGQPSAKSDVFGFGATLYRLLTQDSPRKLNPRRLADAPELFELLCDCVEEEPTRRLSIEEIINQLERLDKRVQPIEEKEEKNEWEDELEKLLETTREKYKKQDASYLSLLYQEEGTVKEDIPVVCPYCDSLFAATEEGGLECPKCHWDFEIDDDGDVISANEE
ncbi:protein kinase [Candidatus Marithioploca araucensis]|uniref:Protein kinase n=1 Tax=Candidatus Marithioploca araucensis TaxID=70273 RepID=A0ABT7VSX1_9GAMM|nr:protein kinase [Candidatus Marithioploca araucensis]